MNVFGLIVGKRHLIASEEGRTLAVGIVLPRASTIIINMSHLGRQTHAHAEFRNQHRLFLEGESRWAIVHFYLDTIVASNGIGQRDISAHG